MKRFLTSVGLVILLVALVLPLSSEAAVDSASPQTYTVLVGWENSQQGVELMAFFPADVVIHAGDTVHWQANSIEIHTVTFGFEYGGELPPVILPAELLGLPPDPSPLVANPAVVNPDVPMDGEYTGGPANSGLLATSEGAFQDFALTFPEPGLYQYVCLVHGWEMSGTVEVRPAGQYAPSPGQSAAQGRKEIAQLLAQVPEVFKAAMAQIEPPVENPDGTLTHTVILGYHEDQIDLIRFFPDKTLVRPGDTVVWAMGDTNEAPHTVTFLNGGPAPGLFIPVEQPEGPPVLYVDPGTLFPAGPGELTRDGYYNSGLMEPIPGPFYSLVIGDMTPGPQPYLCLLHDESGMTGTLVVLPSQARSAAAVGETSN